MLGTRDLTATWRGGFKLYSKVETEPEDEPESESLIHNPERPLVQRRSRWVLTRFPTPSNPLSPPRTLSHRTIGVRHRAVAVAAGLSHRVMGLAVCWRRQSTLSSCADNLESSMGRGLERGESCLRQMTRRVVCGRTARAAVLRLMQPVTPPRALQSIVVFRRVVYVRGNVVVPHPSRVCAGRACCSLLTALLSAHSADLLPLNLHCTFASCKTAQPPPILHRLSRSHSLPPSRHCFLRSTGRGPAAGSTRILGIAKPGTRARVLAAVREANDDSSKPGLSGHTASIGFPTASPGGASAKGMDLSPMKSRWSLPSLRAHSAQRVLTFEPDSDED